MDDLTISELRAILFHLEDKMTVKEVRTLLYPKEQSNLVDEKLLKEVCMDYRLGKAN